MPKRLWWRHRSKNQVSASYHALHMVLCTKSDYWNGRNSPLSNPLEESDDMGFPPEALETSWTLLRSQTGDVRHSATPPNLEVGDITLPMQPPPKRQYGNQKDNRIGNQDKVLEVGQPGTAKWCKPTNPNASAKPKPKPVMCVYHMSD